MFCPHKQSSERPEALRGARALPTDPDSAGAAPMQPAPEPRGSSNIFHQNLNGKCLIPLKMSACFEFVLLDKLNMENGKYISRNPNGVERGQYSFFQ